MSETLQIRGTLRGHNGWVTQIATNPKYPDMILSCSRDKTLIVWKLTRDEANYGTPQKRLHGHSHFVSDVVLSSDGNYALSGSWDKTLRLWDLAAGRTTRRFEDHTKDVLSVAFSVDNRQIVSGSRDKTIKLWNTLAECKYTIQIMPIVKFQSNWKSDFPWVKEGKLKNTAECILCKSSFSYDTMGRAALTSHAKGKKHKAMASNQEKTLPLNYFVQSVPPSVSHSGPNINSPSISLSTQNIIRSADPCAANISTNNSTLDKFKVKDSVTEAEILWCINTVMTHNSLRSAESSVLLFSRMFPDSSIAQAMKLHKDKISYSLVYGLAVYFKEELKKELKESTYYVVGFDESLNKIAQRSQMDLFVRYYNKNTQSVKARYLDSVFLDQTKASDLVDAFKTGLSNIDSSKIIQISMDGPNVNWSFLKLIKEELKNTHVDSSELLQLGSCGLHVIHGAFKTGVIKTQWRIIPFLRALYNLFRMVPARRGHFTEVTGSSIFPLPFCNIRWVENSRVAKRAQEILPSVMNYVNSVCGTKKEPSSQSFEIVSSALKDPLLSAKLAFFESLAVDLEPFLREFQTDAPMVPFLYQCLINIIKNLMYEFVKKEKLIRDNFHKLNLFEKEDNLYCNLIPAKELDLGYATRAALKKCKGVNDKDMLCFKKDVRICLQHVVAKIQDKSPLRYPLTKATSFLNPNCISSNDVEAYDNMKACLDILVQSNVILPCHADMVDKEYKDLLTQEYFKSSCNSYKRSETRLDEFWFKETCKASITCENLHNVVKIILILSHGNASVERGFSVNKEILAENMKEESLVAQRVIYDTVNNAGGIDVWSRTPIPKTMILAMRNSHSRYKEAEETRKKAMTEKDKRAAEKRKAAFQLKQLEEKKRKTLEQLQNELNSIDEEIKNDDGHSDWVSCVRFSPNHANPIIVSAGWDKVVKVWNLTNCRLKINHYGHTGYLNTVTVSPDGSLCASGGKDCKAMLWDLNDGKHLHTLDHNDIITALCFSPNRYWLCAAFGPFIKIWDLETKDMVEELKPEVVSSQTSKAEPPQCLSLAWSTDGQTLFAGYSDNIIRVWQVSVSAR